MDKNKVLDYVIYISAKKQGPFGPIKTINEAEQCLAMLLKKKDKIQVFNNKGEEITKQFKLDKNKPFFIGEE